MLFNINNGWQLLGWLLVFAGLVVANEFARRTKIGGIVAFMAIPGALTIYFLVVIISGKCGAGWAQENWTYKYMNSWFHYAKLYAATAGCIGFMMIKYGWGIGKERWFKPFPFLIVAINILIAVGSDFESGIKGLIALNSYGTRWWVSSEDVLLYGGWWNWANGIAGIINIACMTGWYGVYASKDKKDMVWPDMIWVYIVAYDIWNFAYTYNNLPTHSWYCGVALLLAPTYANAFWNKGGWIQNRANTLAIWCMFAQVFPLFQDRSRFTTYPSLYGKDYTWGKMVEDISKSNYKIVGEGGVYADPTMQGVISALALVVNVIALTAIIKRSVQQKKNPYTNEIFTDTKDFKLAMDRVDQLF